MLLKNLHRGFTAIELMMALAVVAILFVVAIPQFVAYTHKGEDDAALATGRAFLAAALSASVEKEKEEPAKTEGAK